MKRLIQTIALSLLAVLALAVPASALTRYQRVTVSQPSATTNQTVSISYEVTSTISTDTYTVELFVNGASKGTQEVTHPYGNSGVFSGKTPGPGTYTYFVRATNHGNGDATQDSNVVAVKVSDAPQPTVTVVNVPANTTAATTAATNATGTPATTTANGGTDANGDGQVDAAAAATSAAKNAGDVLGAETNGNGNKNDSNNTWSYLAGLAALLAIAGGAYYLLVVRRRTES